MLDQLSTDGVTINLPNNHSIIIKAKLVLGIFDLPAKAAVLSMKLFNAQFSCTTCYHPGIYMSRWRVFPPLTYRNRTHQQIKSLAQRAIRHRRAIKGVKGLSPLEPYVDLVQCIPIDYMHCVLEGTVKRLMTLWFKSKNHRKTYYLGNAVNEIDMILMSQTPPNEFKRSPRSIASHRKFWIANEIKQWFLYYSLPILQNKLPPVYWHHYALLVGAIHILLKDNISVAELEATDLTSVLFIWTNQLYSQFSFIDTLNQVRKTVGSTLDSQCIFLWTQEWLGKKFISWKQWHKQADIVQPSWAIDSSNTDAWY